MRVPVATATVGDPESVRQAVAMLPQPKANSANLRGTFLPPEMDQTPTAPPDGEPTRIEADGDKLSFLREPSQAAAVYGWFRDQLLNDCEGLAKRIGVPALARFKNHLPPPP